jgi:hypothetical protein
MPSTSSRILTLPEAAQMICRTKTPTADDLSYLRRELETGSLQGKRKGTNQWVISTDQVAEYLAKRAMLTRTRYAQDRASVAGKATIRTVSVARGSSELCDVYHNIFKDYFLAVMLRRKVDRASRTFGRLVLMGQILLLLALMFGTVAAMRATFLTPHPPERQAVEAWIARQTSKYTIERWFPTETPDDDDEDFVSVRVQYRYFTSGGKSIDSDRTFRVEGNRAMPHDGDD